MSFHSNLSLNGVAALGVAAVAAVTSVGAYFYLGKKKPKPVLTYFDGRGLAEPARLLLADAGVEFTDVRLSGDDFRTLKESGRLPYGQVPMLEIGNLKIAQSGAIYRYIAREYGYYGSNSEEAALIDGILDCLATDVRPPMRIFTYSSDISDEKKAELKAKFTNETLPKWVGVFEKFLKENAGGKGFIVGKHLSIADVALFDFFTSNSKDYPNALDKAPLLKALFERIGARPRLALYLAGRKQTPF